MGFQVLCTLWNSCARGGASFAAVNHLCRRSLINSIRICIDAVCFLCDLIRFRPDTFGL